MLTFRRIATGSPEFSRPVAGNASARRRWALQHLELRMSSLVDKLNTSKDSRDKVTAMGCEPKFPAASHKLILAGANSP
jgi:hypothetical protein